MFLLLGNERVNRFWAANVPPSEALTPSSCTEVRRLYITNKYRQGKYRKYHQLFGNQKELNNVSRNSERMCKIFFRICQIWRRGEISCEINYFVAGKIGYMVWLVMKYTIYELPIVVDGVVYVLVAQVMAQMYCIKRQHTYTVRK